MSTPSPVRRFVALSISEPEEHDLVRHGVDSSHLDIAFLDLSRHLLAAGYSLAYGGDLRLRGFTDRLFDLVRAYRLPAEPAQESEPQGRDDEISSPPKRVRVYLADYIHDAAFPQVLADARNVADVVRVSAGAPPAEIDGDAEAMNAQALTAMRRRITDDSVARIMIGGRLLGAAGRAPGVLEEAWCSVASEKPLFVVGVFGGVSEMVADALVDERRVSERMDAIAADERYRRLSGRLAAVSGDAPADGAAMLSDITARGIDGLHNGLNREENRNVFTSRDLDLVIGLVLRGLDAVSPG
jgi:hypothetical protein